MGWTDERVTALKSLWAEGLSASQIAKSLGGGVTRNAVIGKVHRLGLAGRATPSRPAKRPLRLTRPRPAASPAIAAPRPPRPSFASQILAGAPPLEPKRNEDGTTVSVLTLSERVCKWPIGDPNDPAFAFCGRQSCAGPYCNEHARLAYQPQRDKKRRAYGEPNELRRMMRIAAM